MKKEKLYLEYPLAAKSQSLLWEHITDHHTLRARVIEREKQDHIQLRWVDEEDPDAFWEMRIGRSELTGDLCLFVTDYALSDDIDDLHDLWDGNLERLHQVSGF